MNVLLLILNIYIFDFLECQLACSGGSGNEKSQDTPEFFFCSLSFLVGADTLIHQTFTEARGSSHFSGSNNRES